MNIMNRTYHLNNNLDDIETNIRKTFNTNVYRDSNLKIFSELLFELTYNHKKVQFIFSKQGVIIPNINDENMLPVMLVDSATKLENRIGGIIQIPKIYIATVRDIPKEYFKLDRYPTKKAGLKDLSELYEHNITYNDVLSMYWLENFQKL
jgi:hypothetical protein